MLIVIELIDARLNIGQLELRYSIKGGWNNNQIPGYAQLSVSDANFRHDRDEL